MPSVKWIYDIGDVVKFKEFDDPSDSDWLLKDAEWEAKIIDRCDITGRAFGYYVQMENLTIIHILEIQICNFKERGNHEF